MPAGIHPIAPAVVRRVDLAVSAANVNRDGTTGSYTTVLVTAGANGSLVNSVRATGTSGIGVTPSAVNVLRLWHQVAGAGAFFLLDEVLLPATAATAVTAGASVAFNRTNIALGALDKLIVTQHTVDPTHYTADLGDY